MIPGLCCPVCRRDLQPRGDGAHVCRCGRTFPEVAGIPDLRLRSDRYLTLDQDRRKAERLARDELSFEETVRLYWSLTPEVPPELAERYARTALDGVRRARRWLDGVELPPPGTAALDVGCGTGALAVALSERGYRVSAVDVALRWLVPAARLAREHAVPVRHVAADGRELPFAPARHDLVVSVEAVEHSDGQRALVQGCLEAVRPGGRLVVVTANRWSLAVEPNVGLWGVGLLPRRLAPAYVRLRRGTRYQFFRAPSAAELRRWAADREMSLRAGPLPTPPTDAPRSRRAAQACYDVLRLAPGLGALAPAVAPFLELSGRVEPQQGSPSGASDVAADGPPRTGAEAG